MKNQTNALSRNLLAVFAAALLMIPALAQEPEKAPQAQEKPKSTERQSPDEDVTAGDKKSGKSLSDAERQAGRRELISEEEAAILPYLNNNITVFRFGPEDKISVLVFGHEKYSMANITIPPDGRVNYPLIGQVVMNGRTAEDVEKEIAEKLSEYIIDPKVTVQIVEAHSMKFMVLGDVLSQGQREMTRRMRVSEAIAAAGYVTPLADKSKITVLRLKADGKPEPIPFNLKLIEKGQGDDFYVAAGDVIVVPGSKFKKVKQVLETASLVGWMRMVVYGR